MADFSFDEAIQAVADAYMETEVLRPGKVKELTPLIEQFGGGDIKQAIGMLCLLASMSEKPFG